VIVIVPSRRDETSSSAPWTSGEAGVHSHWMMPVTVVGAEMALKWVCVRIQARSANGEQSTSGDGVLPERDRS
jgi:hypothetical protein